MKKIVVFGLGNFGITIAKTLVQNGAEVLGVDSNIEVVNSAKDYISFADMEEWEKRFMKN